MGKQRRWSKIWFKSTAITHLQFCNTSLRTKTINKEENQQKKLPSTKTYEIKTNNLKKSTQPEGRFYKTLTNNLKCDKKWEKLLIFWRFRCQILVVLSLKIILFIVYLNIKVPLLIILCHSCDILYINWIDDKVFLRMKRWRFF